MLSSNGEEDQLAGLHSAPIHPRTARPPGVSGKGSWLRTNLNVFLHRRQLDRELADGLAPDASNDRALRARKICDATARRQLARSVRQLVSDALVAEAERSPNMLTGLMSAMGPIHQTVMIWREPLLELADRLEQPEPISACGVARTLDLLTDGLGPLYDDRSERSMSEAIGWIADGMRLCPPHDWGCPVIAKLDPAHVAWTCSRCGEIAMSDDLAVSPQ